MGEFIDREFGTAILRALNDLEENRAKPLNISVNFCWCWD
jgi:hypothetical protein